MKSRLLRFLLALPIVLGLSTTVKAQLPPFQPEQDCPNAIVVCNGFYSQVNSYVGTGSVPAELNNNNQGCLQSGEKNDVWYKITITSPGMLEFLLTPFVLSDDYDFALWDITNGGCSLLYNYINNSTNGYLPVGCNYSGVSGITGLSSTNATAPYSPAINVTVGQVLVLNVSNYEAIANNGYTLDFGNSTAGFLDTVKPRFEKVETLCRKDSLIVTMNKEIRCNTLSSDGSDFYVTNAAGAVFNPFTAFSPLCSSPTSTTSRFALFFNNSFPNGNYTLRVRPGADANTTVSLCSNKAQDSTDAFPFTILAEPAPTMTLDTPGCLTLRIRYSSGIKCANVSPDDFKVTGPSPVVVIGAAPVGCDAKGYADTVIIKFQESILLPGLYTVTPTRGTQTNKPIVDSCNSPVNVPANFIVSDKGVVSATVSPSVLCEPGYVELDGKPGFPLVQPTGACIAHLGPLPNIKPVDYQVGAGVVSSNLSSPFYTNFRSAKTQFLLLGTDLQAAGITPGTFTSLRLRILQKNTTVPMNGFTIKLGCVQVPSLGNGLQPSPSTTVFGPTTYSSQAGVANFPFHTPYDWNGTSNVVIEFCFSNTATGGFNGDALEVTLTPYVGMISIYQNTDVCNVLTAQNSIGGNQVPNIIFGHVPLAPLAYERAWSPGTFVGDSTAFKTLAFVSKTSTFTLQVKDTVGCFRRESTTVTVSKRNPELLSLDTNVCIGDFVTLQAGPAESYLWFPSTGLSCTTCPNPVATPTVSIRYSVVLTDRYGCSDTLSVFLRVDPLPIVRASFEDTLVVFGSPVQAYVYSPGGRYFLWDPPFGVSDVTAPNPIIRPESTSRYNVLVIDTNQCRGTDSFVIRVKTDIPVFVPDAFTPNGDGINDIFRVSLLTFQRVQEFRIYNRWGREVFYTIDERKGWDGNFKGSPQPVDTYNYIVRVAYPDGRTEMKKGTVTLIR